MASDKTTPAQPQAMSSDEVFEKLIKPRVWLKNYDEDVPPNIDIPEVPLYKLLDDSAQSYGSHTALIFYKRKVSYTELKEATDRFARALADSWGVQKGDVVSLYLPNTPQFAIAYYGALKAGATVNPINPLYTGEEVSFQLRTSKTKVLVALDIFKDKVDDALSKAENVEAVVYTGVDDYLPGILGFLYRLKTKKPKINYDGQKVAKFKEVLESHQPNPPLPPVNPREDVAALMYTGGTTGRPKGAMLTHYNLVSNVHQIDAWLEQGRKARDVLIGVLPWFHIYGQTAVLHTGIFRAGTIIVLPRFELKEVLDAIVKYRANMFHGVPTIYSLIVNYKDIQKYDLSSVEVCISGAAPLPKSVAEKFEKLTGGRLREGYGLTETSPVTHVNPIKGKYKIGSIGVPVPNTYAAVADPVEPRLLPPGDVGELVVSGPQVMKGYYAGGDENVFFEAYRMRWFRTGDMAKMDEDGFFYIVDRKKDLIKYKGYSVYPREIEEVLYKHECVAEAAVIGVPDPNVGERVKAFISLKPECKGKVSETDIIEYCKQHLAPYKVPKEIEFRDQLPKSAVGKVLRRVLKEEELKKQG